jgi:hypothetical protein
LFKAQKFLIPLPEGAPSKINLCTETVYLQRFKFTG